MRRREFMTLLAGAAATWPIAASAQKPAKLPTIGLLGGGTPATQSQWAVAFTQRLRTLGWSEGSSIVIEYRWAEGRPERFAEIAAELVRLKVDVILAAGTEATLAAKQATAIIPIVFPVAGDPVGTGLVASLARPGANVTGVSNQSRDLAAKRLELFREVVRGLRRSAILVNAGYPAAVLEMGEVHSAARTLGIEVIPFEIRRSEDIAPAFATRRGRLCRWRPAVDRQPHACQRPCAHRAPTDNLFATGVSRRRRSDVLWTELSGAQSPRRRSRRQDFARREAGRPPGRAADQV